MNTVIRWSLLVISTAAAYVSYSPSTSSYHDLPLRFSVAPAPLIEPDDPHKTINNAYIVIFKKDIPTALTQNHLDFVRAAHALDPLVEDALSGVNNIYEGYLNGYAGRFTDAVIAHVRYMYAVAY